MVECIVDVYGFDFVGGKYVVMFVDLCENVVNVICILDEFCFGKVVDF